MNIKKVILAIFLFSLFILLYLRCNKNPTSSKSEVDVKSISGHIYDGSKFFGFNDPIPNCIIKYAEYTTSSNDSGYFFLEYSGPIDPMLEMEANNFHKYNEKPSRMVNGAFYLIPSGQIYKDFGILTWDYSHNNPHNWHRKWDRQTKFYIIQNNATDKQIEDLISILLKDEYNKMTGGLYHSNELIQVLASDPNWNSYQKKGKTKIYFADGIISGGIGHSDDDDGDGNIDYAEIGWDTNQQIDENIVWHELSHTVTAGGHINYRQSVNSETHGGGKVFSEDEKVFNCIYSSPPKRLN